MAGLQQVAAGLVRDSGELGPIAGQPGPAQWAAVLLQSGQLGRRRLDLGHAVDQLRVLLAQTRLAEMVHHCQHLSSLSPAEEDEEETEEEEETLSAESFWHRRLAGSILC